jgi:glycosyltransferase involved in cell wall biosynthesis
MVDINNGSDKPLKEIRVLFAAMSFASFVQRDLMILRRHFQVKAVEWKDTRDILEVIKEIPKNDVSYIWFGTIRACIIIFFSKIFGKKTIVVAGGLDTAKVPEINYGLMNRPFYRIFPIFAFRFADAVLAVSRTTKQELEKYVGIRNALLIYNAIEHDLFAPKGRKEDIVVTVSSISPHTFLKKGLETFVRVAKELPNIKFELIGAHEDTELFNYLNSIASSNTHFFDYLPDSEFLEHLQKARIYAQLSRHESFGCALAEAMLCECTPVVTNCTALPEVVGDTGFYAPYNNVKATVDAIKAALVSKKGKLARERIIKLFPIEKREKELVEIITKIAK